MLDIKFNTKHGDFSFRNDIEMIVGDNLKKETILDRVKSGYMSYRLNENYGANINRHVGKGITESLISSIEQSIVYALTYDSYLALQDLKVLVLTTDKPNELYIRIIVQGSDAISVSTTISIGDNIGWVQPST